MFFFVQNDREAVLSNRGFVGSDFDFEILYFSERAMYMFAKALMEKTFEHYDQDSQIQLEKIENNGTKVRFLISKKNGAYQKN